MTPIPVGPGGDGAFQVYPLVGPLMHFDAIEAASRDDEDVQAPGGSVRAKKFKARRVIESSILRTTTEAEFWRCDPQKIPFGLAKWSTKTTIDRKDDSARTVGFQAGHASDRRDVGPRVGNRGQERAGRQLSVGPPLATGSKACWLQQLLEPIKVLGLVLPDRSLGGVEQESGWSPSCSPRLRL